MRTRNASVSLAGAVASETLAFLVPALPFHHYLISVGPFLDRKGVIVMRQAAFRILISLFLIISFVIFSFPARHFALAWSDSASESGKGASKNEGIKFERPPLRFEINEGQSDPQVRFTARERDGAVFLTSAGATLQITKPLPSPHPKPALPKLTYNLEEMNFESSFVRLKTVGANPYPRMIGLERLPGVTNYFIGNDPKRWRSGVAGYARVRCESVYPGIDLVYYGNDEGRLEYDFIVAPGADPNQIALSIEGARSVELDPAGELIIGTATGEIRQPAPRIYQEVDGERRQIAGRYRLLEEREIGIPHSAFPTPTVGFALEEYDASRALVIDPEIVYATYLGGALTSPYEGEDATDVAVDEEGSVYIVGTTASADFPTRNPLQGVLKGWHDAFVTKLDTNGQMVYSTFLGGNIYSDVASAVTVDSTGAVYVGGGTGASDFPLVNPIQGPRGGGDAFFTKLSPDGSRLVYSTRLGGELDDGAVRDMAMDAENNLYVVGTIEGRVPPGNDFPMVNPIQATHGGGLDDGFMSVIDATGSRLLFSTYLGGDGEDRFQSISLNPSNGDVYLGYFTDSSNFPPGGSSVVAQVGGGAGKSIIIMFYARLDENNLLEFELYRRVSFFVNSPSVDTKIQIEVLIKSIEFFAVDIDQNPNPSSQSGTASAHAVHPQAGGGHDVRLTVFDRDLNITNTVFFGGSNEEFFPGTAKPLAVDVQGAVYITGFTRSTDLPTVNPILANPPRPGKLAGFLAVLHPQTLQPVFSTYLGGTDFGEVINSITVDRQGNIYIVGTTESQEFPAPTPGAIQNQRRGLKDAFLIKISPVEIPTIPDFTLSASSSALTVQRGAKTNLTINVNRIAGFNGEVTITGPDTSAIKVKVKPASQSTSGEQAKFKLKAKSNASVGDHELVFTGADQSGRRREARIRLTIQ
jgi:hypothetical protein